MTNTIATAIRVALVVLCTVIGCATPQSPDSAPARDSSEFSYFNERHGVRLDVPPEWKLYTQADEAPPALADAFAASEATGNTVLLMGQRVGADAFLQLVTEPSPFIAEDYFAMLVTMYESRFGVLEAEWSDERDTGHWRYRVEVGILVFIFDETVTVSGGHAIRLASWTMEGLATKYEPEFSALAESVEFERDGRWIALWKGLESSLSSEKWSHLDLYSEPPDAPVAACPDGERQSLWRVEGESATVYLFGSIHLGKSNFYPLPDVIEQAFAESHHLVVEVDVNDEEGQKRMGAAILDAVLLDDQTLEDVLDPVVFENLSTKMFDLGLPLEPFLQREPWALALMISVLKIQAAGYMPDQGVEQYFHDMRTHQDVIELEGVETQLSLFEKIDGELFLAFTLLTLDSFDDQLEAMMQAWRCGDEKALADLTVGQYSQAIPGVDDILRLFFTDRNMEMKRRLEGMLREGQGQYFVVVGAAHLPGKDGIIDLLRRSGWQVDSI